MKFINSLIRIFAIAGKEWIQIYRDKRSLYNSIISPIIFVLLFGYALTVDVKNVSIAIFDQDKTSTSRKYLEEFSHTEYLRIFTYVSSYKEIDKLINSEDIKLAIVVPRNFEKSIKSGKKPKIQLLADGSDSMSATIAIGYIKVITANYNFDMMINDLKRIGISETRMPVEVKSRIWYNPELLSKNFIIPGLFVMILSIISALTTSLTISREWERGTMETLISTPLRGYELVLGKIIPYIFIGIFDMIFMLFTGYFIFNVPFKGNFIELCLLGLLFLIGALGTGMLISSVTRKQALSVTVALLSTFLPVQTMSGFIFPIQNMPVILQSVTYLIPAKYLIALVKTIVLKGVSSFLLWTQILFLFLYAVLIITVCIKKITLRLPED